MQKTYKVEDVFEKVPGDDENVNFKIPPEIAKELDLKPGDPMKIEIGDQGTLLIKKINVEEEIKAKKEAL